MTADLAGAHALAGIRERDGADPTQPVHPDAFAREVHRERARAHRTGSAFLVVTMRVATRAGTPHEPQRRRLALLLADVLRRRARTSDVVGWRTEYAELGAILPSTPAAGAACFIDAVERGLQERLREEPDLDTLQPELVCEVFAYPEPVGALSSRAVAHPV